MKKLGAFFAICAVAAFSAQAEVQLERGPFTLEFDGLDATDCEGEIKWVQEPDGASGLAAQDDQCYPFLAQIADNFLGDGNDIVGVGWYGVYWNGSPLPPDAFRIEIYTSDADGCPGDLVYSDETSDYNQTLGAPDGYCSQVTPFNKADGVSYHISVTAVFCFPPQYGSATGVGDGQQACFRSAFFGFADWTPATDVFGVPYDLAFLLYNEPGTPTEEASWSSIKKLYQ